MVAKVLCHSQGDFVTLVEHVAIGGDSQFAGSLVSEFHGQFALFGILRGAVDDTLNDDVAIAHLLGIAKTIEVQTQATEAIARLGTSHFLAVVGHVIVTGRLHTLFQRDSRSVTVQPGYVGLTAIGAVTGSLETDLCRREC